MNTNNLIKNASILFLGLYGFCNILFSFLLSEVFRVIESGDLSEFHSVTFSILFLVVVQHIFQLISTKLRMVYASKKMILINNRYFADDIKGKKDVDMGSYSSKTDMIVNNYLANEILIPFNIIQVVITIVAYMWLSPILVVYMFAVVGFMMVIPQLSKKKSEEYTNDYTNCSKNYINFLTNVFTGKNEINQYGAVETYAKKHEKEVKNLFKQYEKRGFFIRSIGIVSNALAFIIFVGLILLCGYLVVTGKLEFVLFLTAVQLMNYFVNPIFSLVEYISQYQSIKNQIPNLKEMANFESEKALNIDEKIELNNVSFRYNEDNLISYPNITFEKNKKYLITGKSGTGKSTLAKILSGENRDYDGTILVDGKLNSENIIYVPQSAHLLYGNVLENIALDRDISRSDIKNAMELANVDEELLHKIIDVNSEVSGGEKARISLARSLAVMPSIMIIDEPTANLDYNNSIQIIEKLCKIKDLTLIVISHEKEEEFISCFDDVVTL